MAMLVLGRVRGLIFFLEPPTLGNIYLYTMSVAPSQKHWQMKVYKNPLLNM